MAGRFYGNHSWTFIESFWYDINDYLYQCNCNCCSRWGLMTLTTVGYDLNPETLLGKIIGGCCALSGVFILTLPIPIVVNSFATYYKNRYDWLNDFWTSLLVIESCIMTWQEGMWWYHVSQDSTLALYVLSPNFDNLHQFFRPKFDNKMSNISSLHSKSLTHMPNKINNFNFLFLSLT